MAFPYVPTTHVDGQSWSAAKANQLEQAVALAGVVGTGSSPPGSPVDGMLWRLPADATLGVYWLLQYESSQATYDWVAYGPGSPLYSQSDTDGTFNSTSYVDPSTTPNASVTVPRAGEYLCEWGFQAGIATDDIDIRCAVKIGSASASDNDAATVVTYNTSGRTLTGHRQKVITAAASDVLKLQYRSVNAGVVALFSHWLFVKPMRMI
jgi:hypothetical protein